MFAHSTLKSQPVPASPLRFPQKLWKIANECQSGAVCWSPDGKSILLRYALFKEEFMSMKSDFFKTDNISSFVRQLNLYGFRKVYDHAHKQAYKANTDVHEFSNTNFQRERPDLLDKVTRKSGILKDRSNVWPENRKFLDYANDITLDTLWDESSFSTEDGDHSYPCSQKSEPPKNLTEFKNLEENVGLMEKEQQDKENEYKPEPALITIPEQTPQNSKKKRGRKPGSKKNLIKCAKWKSERKNDRCPTLKNLYHSQRLMYFQDDDDDDIFLRNTSKDVMLSSTLPFQETLEYLELKETYDRLYDPKLRTMYGFFLPISAVKLL